MSIQGLNIGVSLDTVQVEQGLAGLKRKLKTANSQMRANMSEFDRGEQSVEAYQARLGELNNKLEIQQRVTQEAGNRYEELAEKHGEGSSQAERAAQEYNNQVAALNNLERYTEQTAEALAEMQAAQEETTSSFSQMGEKLHQQADTMDEVGGKMQSFGGTWSKVTGGIAAAAGGAGAASFGLANSTAEAGNEMLTQSERVGMSVEAYQEMEFWASRNNIEQTKMDSALERTSRRMGQAADGNEGYADALEKMGINMEDVKNGTMSTEDVFEEAITHLQGMESATDANSLASEFFGETMSNNLMPALQDGAETFEDTSALFDEKDLGMSEEDAEAGREFSQSMDMIYRAMGNVTQQIGLELMPHFQRFVTLLQENLPQIQEIVTNAMDRIIESVRDVVQWWNNLSGSAQSFIGIAAGVVAAVGPLAVAFGTVLRALSPFVRILGTAFSWIGRIGGIMPVLTAAFTALTGPIGLTVTAVTALVGVFTYLWTTNEGFRDAVIGIWNRIQEVAYTVFGWIGEFLSGIWSTISEEGTGMWSTLQEFISFTLERLTEGIGQFAEIGMSIFGWFRDQALHIWDMFGENLIAIVSGAFEFIEQLIRTTIEIFSNIFQLGLNLIMGNWDEAWQNISNIFSAFSDFLRQAGESFWEILTNIFDAGLTFITELWSTVWNWVSDFISSIWSGISETFNTAISWIVDFVQTAFRQMRDFINTIFTAISNFFSNIWSTISDTFSSIISSIVTWVRERWNSLSDTTRSIFNSISTFFSNIWQSIRSTISNFVTRIFNAVRNAWNDTLNTTRDIFNRLFNWASNLWDDLWSTVTGSASDILSGVTNAWDSTWTETRRMFNRISNWVSDTFDNIVGWARNLPGRIGDGISNMASSAVDGVETMVNNMADGLEDGINAVINGLDDLLGIIGIDIGLEELSIPRLEGGTSGHPGGPAMINDGRGPELVQTPGGNPGFVGGQNQLVNLPKGSKVASYEKTNRMLGGGVPKYSGGIGSWASSAWDSVTDLGGSAWDAITGSASAVWDFLSDGASAAIEEIFDLVGIDIPEGDNALAGLARGTIEQIKDALISVTDRETMASVDFTGLDFPSPFRKTSGYGPRDSPGGIGSTYHRGVDFAAPIGTPIPAQGSGRVVTSEYAGGLGNLVEIESGNILYRYGHNDSNAVDVGDQVSAGDTIGLVGTTGNSTGPHVHFEIHEDGSSVDPEEWSPPTPDGSEPPGSGVQRWRSTVQQALSMNNLPTTDAYTDAWLRQIDTESGGDASITQSSAVRDINQRTGNLAEGLVQVIPPTFAQYSHAGHNNPFNGLDNLLAGMNYAKSRYGSSGMLSMIGQGHGYRSGGVVDYDGMAMLHGGRHPEYVIPTDPSKASEAQKLLALAGRDISDNNSSGGSIPSISGSNSGGGDLEGKIDKMINGINALMEQMGKQKGDTIVNYTSPEAKSHKEVRRDWEKANRRLGKGL